MSQHAEKLRTLALAIAREREARHEFRFNMYRLYNPNSGEHFYTADAAERDGVVRAGWRYEGVGWYSDDARSVPLWREFNPNVDPGAATNNSGSHNYTTSRDEHEFLCSAGWRDEGVGWYAVAGGRPE